MPGREAPSVPPAAAWIRLSTSKGGGSILSPLAPAERSGVPLLRPAERDDVNPFLAFWRTFVAPAPPTGIQKPGWRRNWISVPRPPTGWQVRDHLCRRYWVGTVARWYPVFAVFDVDSPGGDPEAVLDRVCARLGLRPGVNALACTSPRWHETRAVHVFVPVVYRGEPATLRLVRQALEPVARDLGFELYPHEKRIFRLPLGRDQHLLRDGLPLNLGWTEALAELLNLEPLDLKALPYNRPLPVPAPDPPVRPGVRGWVRLEEARRLLLEGLPGPGTRDEACFLLACYFWRLNYPPERAVEEIWAWIQRKHNGFSKAINAGRWKRVYRDIERWVGYAYRDYPYYCGLYRSRGAHAYPDDVHNLEGFLIPADLRFAAAVFPGDVVNQRRLLRLLAWWRPRSFYDWVFIPRRVWREIAPGAGGDHRAYLAFRRRLEEAGILEASPDGYRHVEGHPELSYPRRFRLRGVPPGRADEMIAEDGRAVRDLAEAAVRAFGGKREAAEALGLPPVTAWRVFDLGYDIDRICPGCGAVIENAHESRKWCSEACRKRYERRRGP